MNIIDIFPRASDDHQKLGWSIDYNFLDEICDVVKNMDCDEPTVEQVESILNCAPVRARILEFAIAQAQLSKQTVLVTPEPAPVHALGDGQQKPPSREGEIGAAGQPASEMDVKFGQLQLPMTREGGDASA